MLASNPIVYFELFQTVTNSLYRVAFCYMLWTKQDQVVKVMHFSGDLAAPSEKVVKSYLVEHIVALMLGYYVNLAPL